MLKRTCCFTGHRNIPAETMALLSQRLDETIRGLIGEGFRYFGAGGALGFDYEKKKVMRSEVLDAA